MRSTEADVNHRVGKASAVFQKMRPIRSTLTITMQTKNQTLQHHRHSNRNLCQRDMENYSKSSKKIECFPTALPKKDSWHHLLRLYHKRRNPAT